jgi:hypothetical protein
MKFRDLTANEIEVRVSRITNAGVELLLFKDSRCDMRILDETVGAENWQNEFYEQKGTLFCKVGLFTDYDRGPMWVWKSNAGAPSNIESQKGEASDAFKRACFTWGIGRELYTAPRIFVYADKCKSLKQGKNGKMQCYDHFSVAKIKIVDGRIVGLAIRNDDTGKVVFTHVEDGYGKEQ